MFAFLITVGNRPFVIDLDRDSKLPVTRSRPMALIQVSGRTRKKLTQNFSVVVARRNKQS